MNIENVAYILSNMDFSEWGIMGTLLVILQNTIQNATASNCDKLIQWAVGIGSILSGVIIALWLKWTKSIEDQKIEISRLNTEILNLQKEHSKELRELHIKNASVLEKASDLLKLKSGL